VVADKLNVPLIVARKERNFETGALRSYDLPKLDPTKRHLVVDDICDGGGTFALLAQAAGVPKSQLALWVTHGIFSGAATNLSNYYEHILTTDSHPGHNRVGCATTIVPVYTAMYEAMVRSR
jgi:ribose-phosphate pyrophosphokinase